MAEAAGRKLGEHHHQRHRAHRVADLLRQLHHQQEVRHYQPHRQAQPQPQLADDRSIAKPVLDAWWVDDASQADPAEARVVSVLPELQNFVYQKRVSRPQELKRHHEHLRAFAERIVDSRGQELQQHQRHLPAERAELLHAL